MVKGVLSEIILTLKACKGVITGDLSCPLPSIRSKIIILFLLFSCVPLLTSRFVGLPKVRKAFQEVRIRDLESVGHKQADLISIWMKERKADVAATAREYLTSSFLKFKPGDKEFQDLTSYLQFFKDNYGYKEISIADDRGEIRVSTREDFLGSSIADFDYFQEALKGNVYVTRVHPSAFPIQNEYGEMERGVPTLFVSGPIRDDKHRIIGVLSLRVDVLALSKEMRRVKLGETGETYLVDENGYMITESRFVSTLREMGLIKKRTSLELKLIDPTTGQLTRGMQACLKEEHGYDAQGYPDYRGVKVLGFWHWIPEYHWGLLSEIDVEEAYRDLYELDRTLISIVFAFTMVVMAVAIFLGQRLTAPVLHLTEVTKKMSSGDLHQRATVGTRDEIGMLAESFNRMVETINNYIKEIQLLHSQSMATIGHLCLSVAHHIDNPLSRINMSADFLIRKLEEFKDVPLCEEFKAHLSKIKEASRHCETVIENLSRMSKISRTEKSPVLLNILLEQILGEVAPQLEPLKIRLVKELAPGVIRVLANHDQIRMVLTNLLSNAIGAMQDGGALTVKTEYLTSEDKVEVTISDTGHGINKKDVPNLFDPNFLLKISPFGKYTGMELSLVQLTVQAYGGTIKVDSEEEKGTIFKVKLPVYRETIPVEAHTD
ncbi:MAG TPA: ATP-binding protein [Candidatus Hypogeohydataceae bacterium YC41]